MSDGFLSLFGQEAAEALRIAWENTCRRWGQPTESIQGYRRLFCRFPGSNETIPLYLRAVSEYAHGGEVLIEVDLPSGVRSPLLIVEEGMFYLFTDLLQVVEDHLQERYHHPPKPWPARFPFGYRTVPAPIRGWIHWSLVQGRRLFDKEAATGVWPDWPVERFVREILEALGTPAAQTGNERHFLFTHDVDRADQLTFALETAQWEATAGIRACYFVPVEVLSKHPHFAERIVGFGHEVGLHGIRHDNRQLEVPPSEYVEIIQRYADLLKNFDIAGYRAPSLLTSEPLRRELAQVLRYDSSLPDTDIYGEAGRHHGCGVWRPYRTGDMLEIPVTLPLDDRLRTLAVSDPVPFWLEKTQRIWNNGGLPMLLTHTNPSLYPSGFALLGEKILRFLEENDVKPATLPREIAEKVLEVS